MHNNNNFTQKSILRYIGVIFFGIIVIYSAFQAKNLILGPQISISEPQNGSKVTFGIYTIRGIAKNISAISLNDSPIFVDEEGQFEEKLIAPPGYSIMKILAKDRFGRTKIRYIHLMNTMDTLPSIDTPELPASITPENEPVETSNNQT